MVTNLGNKPMQGFTDLPPNAVDFDVQLALEPPRWSIDGEAHFPPVEPMPEALLGEDACSPSLGDVVRETGPQKHVTRDACHLDGLNQEVLRPAPELLEDGISVPDSPRRSTARLGAAPSPRTRCGTHRQWTMRHNVSPDPSSLGTRTRVGLAYEVAPSVWSR